MTDLATVWTIESVLTHLSEIIVERELKANDRFSYLEKMYQDGFTAHRAFDDQRFTDMNRAIEKALAALDYRLSGMNEFRLSLEDKNNTLLSKAEFIGQHAMVLNQIQSLEKRLDRKDGVGEGANLVWVYIVSAISVISTIVSLILGFKK